MPRRSSNRPVSINIRTYQVGFGDCFLLSFTYPNRERHVLVDFGSMRRPKGSTTRLMTDIANDIVKRCTPASGKPKLHVVVATHRHQDHISGFATRTSGKGPGDIIASLEPDAIVQPWTEHPDAPEDAEVAPSRDVRQAFTAQLDRMHAVAGSVAQQIKHLRSVDPAMRARLGFLGEDNVKNASAVKNLINMGKGGRNIYAHEGESLALGRLLPGVKIHVLGPPTLAQSEAIRRQVSTHPTEYWHLQESLAEVADEDELLFPDAPRQRGARRARWFIKRLEYARAEEFLQIVTMLDRQMNNTSLILLFEVGDRLLLFPGDAQIENWQHALGKEKYRELLRKVDVYKVGHHGSLNATPRESLWEKFSRRGPEDKERRLTTILSSMEGVHGSESRRSEVPRNTLVDALEEDTNLLSTEEYSEGDLFQDIEIKL